MHFSHGTICAEHSVSSEDSSVITGVPPSTREMPPVPVLRTVLYGRSIWLHEGEREGTSAAMEHLSCVEDFSYLETITAPATTVLYCRLLL